MLFGVSGCCVCIILEAAAVASFGADGTNKGGLGVGVFAIFFFFIPYGLGIDAVGAVFYGEIFPNHIRAKGLSLAIATLALVNMVYLQAASTAFANIGWKFYMVCLICASL